LVAAGLSLLAGCIVLQQMSFDVVFEHGHRLEDRPTRTVVGILWAMSAVYVIVAWRSYRHSPALGWVLLFGVLFRVVLLPSRPIQEDDIYRYVWDGKVAAAGLDPFLMSPREVIDAPTVAESRSLRGLPEWQVLFKQVEERSAENAVILSRVNHSSLATIYPPFVQQIFRLHGKIVPHDWPVDRQIVAMKCLLGLFDFATLALLPWLLAVCRLPRGLCVLYAWCPLVLKELANSGHLDSIPTFFVVAAVAAVLSVGNARDVTTTIARTVGAGFLLGLSIAAKFYAVVLLPLFWRRLGMVRGAIAVFACCNVVAVLLGLYSSGAEHRRETMTIFALSWENHAALFSSLRSWLDRLTNGAEFTIASIGAEKQFSYAQLYARFIVSAVIGAFVLWNAWKSSERVESKLFVERCFIVLAAFFVLSPVGYPWYFVWCVPFLAFSTRRAWCVLPGILLTYYLGFWYEYQYDEEDLWWVLFDPIVLGEMLIFFTALGVEGIVEVKRRESWRE